MLLFPGRAVNCMTQTLKCLFLSPWKLMSVTVAGACMEELCGTTRVLPATVKNDTAPLSDLSSTRECTQHAIWGIIYLSTIKQQKSCRYFELSRRCTIISRYCCPSSSSLHSTIPLLCATCHHLQKSIELGFLMTHLCIHLFLRAVPYNTQGEHSPEGHV